MKTKNISQDTGGKSVFMENAIRLFPLIIILTVLPFIVRLHTFSNGLSQFPWYSAEDFQVDFFLHGKSVLLNAMGIYMLVMLAAYALMGKLEKRKPWILIPVAVYAVMAFVSSAISQYSAYSFAGNSEGFESIWTVLTYCLIVVYAFYMLRSARDVKILLYSFSAAVFVLTIIGFFQAIGNNPLEIEWISNLTIPEQYREVLADIVVYEDGTYLTLYNTNYVGVYMAMAVPVMLFLVFAFDKKTSFSSVKNSILTILHVIIFTVLLIGTIYCLYISESEAGLLAAIAALVCVPIVMYRKLWKHKMVTIGGAVVVVILIAVLGSSYIAPAFNALKNQLSTEAAAQDLTLNVAEDGITFNYKGTEIRFAMEEDTEMDYWIFNAFDSEGNRIPFADGATWIYNFDDPYSDFEVMYYPVENKLAMTIVVDGTEWVFTCYKDAGNYQMLNIFNKWVTLPDAERFTPLDGYERLFSGRGFIWSRTIPLLKQSAVLGVGADCFMFAFPQTDYVGRAQSGYAQNALFSKPHSLYLQMAVQYGIPAMIAFLTFMGMYFAESFKLYSKKKLNSFAAIAGMGIFIAMIAYMITGITNDSMVVVSPLFWTLFGIGIAVNRMLQNIPDETAATVKTGETAAEADAAPVEEKA